MKNTRECPKCQSDDITRIEGQVGVHGVGNNILFGQTTFGAVPVTRFLCLNCGFIEEWIEYKDDLEKIRKKIDAKSS